MKRTVLGLVFGGRSPEHEVSLVSARGIFENLDTSKYDIVLIGIDRQGRPRVGKEDLLDGEMDRGAGEPCRWPSSPEDRAMRKESNGHLASPPLDVVFPIVHGAGGEDGSLQGLLALAGIACVGPGVLGSSLAMDKDRSRRMLERAKIPVIEDVVLSAGEAADVRAARARLQECSWYPDVVFVKPARAGSSVGITRVTDDSQLESALKAARDIDAKVVIERGLAEPREIEVAVLGMDDVQASIPGEILPHGEFYDYRAKYEDEESKLLIPAPIDEQQTRTVRELAIRAFRELDLHGLARVDFLLSKADGRLVLNEVNTLPGFTPISMYPRLWEASGLPYTQMLDKLIGIALAAEKRHPLGTFSFQS